jgi:hypothetical protein
LDLFAEEKRYVEDLGMRHLLVLVDDEYIAAGGATYRVAEKAPGIEVEKVYRQSLYT